MGWTFFYMFVVLKVPIAFALWLVWWAAREPDPAEEEPREGGSDRHPHRPRPGRPRPPRRGGPHGSPPPAPERVRVRAAGRTFTPR